jgi:hypothetical protein
MKYPYDISSSSTSAEMDKIKKTVVSLGLAASLLSATNFQTESTPLLRNGLMQIASSSRPERLPGELRFISKRSTARALLKHAGTWKGDDLEQCLKEVYAARGETEF